MSRDPVVKWVDSHPRTLLYIAIVVTAILVLQILTLVAK